MVTDGEPMGAERSPEAAVPAGLVDHFDLLADLAEAGHPGGGDGAAVEVDHFAVEHDAPGVVKVVAGGRPASRADSCSNPMRNASSASSCTSTTAPGVVPAVARTAVITLATSASGPYGVPPSTTGSDSPRRLTKPCVLWTSTPGGVVVTSSPTSTVPSVVTPTTVGNEPVRLAPPGRSVAKVHVVRASPR
jgi:hypothetical protein